MARRQLTSQRASVLAFVVLTTLPRVSRILIYLGYILMTVTVVTWFVASHDLTAVGRLTGDQGILGLEAFGKPLLYTIFVAALVGAFRGEGITALNDDAETTSAVGADGQPGVDTWVVSRGAD